MSDPIYTLAQDLYIIMAENRLTFLYVEQSHPKYNSQTSTSERFHIILYLNRNLWFRLK